MNKISKGGIEIRLKHIPKTIECGLHSGYPVCCIKFYISDKWLWAFGDGKTQKNIGLKFINEKKKFKLKNQDLDLTIFRAQIV